MRLFQLDKKVFSVTNGAEKLLNGLTSNDVNQPFNAFCNLHGRIVATFAQKKNGADEFLLVVAADAVKGLLEHLDRYIKLSKVGFVPKPDLNVYFDPDGDYKPGAGEVVIPETIGQYVITEQTLEPSFGKGTFTLFRLQNNIPLHCVDYFDDFLLNVDEEKYVSYTKGCFLGQEPISKVHNRSQPSWRLVVKYEGECNEEEKKKMTSKMEHPDNGKVMGFTFERNQAE